MEKGGTADYKENRGKPNGTFWDTRGGQSRDLPLAPAAEKRDPRATFLTAPFF